MVETINRKVREESNLEKDFFVGGNRPNVPMNTAALEAKDIAKGHRGPLRVLHATVTTHGISRQGFDHCLVLRSHLHHLLADSTRAGNERLGTRTGTKADRRRALYQSKQIIIGCCGDSAETSKNLSSVSKRSLSCTIRQQQAKDGLSNGPITSSSGSGGIARAVCSSLARAPLFDMTATCVCVRRK